MFNHAVISRAQMDTAEMRAAVEAERIAREADDHPGVAHQVGHAIKAVGSTLVRLGDTLDRHDDNCGDCPSMSQAGLAHP